jgi:hypothetical protein
VVQAFERARLAASDVLASIGHGDSLIAANLPETVNLEPTTGPIPVVGAEEPQPAEVAEAEPSVPEPVAVEPGPEPEITEPAPESDDRVIQLPTRPIEEVEPAEVKESDQAESATVVALFAGEIEPEPESEPESASLADVDDLFARLRAASAEMVAREAALDTTPSPQDAAEERVADDSPADEPTADGPFAERDEALVPIILATARKMKRVLAEEQNSLFDAVRQHGAKRQPLTTLEALLPPLGEHVALYRTAIDEHLRAAAVAGAASVTADGEVVPDQRVLEPSVLAPLDEAVQVDIVQPLRERLERCLHEAEGDPDEFVATARSAYREWKSQYIDEHVDDLVRLAHGRGAFAALAPGARICWLVDPNGPACPDAEDNALAGVVPAGSEFPTGHQHPPAHAGCRCLLGLADR